MIRREFSDGTVINPARLAGLRVLANLLPLHRQKKILNEQSGTHASRLRGRGIDFAEVRGYQPGDDIRSMDWRVTARTGEPHIKVFREERERPVLLVTDLRSSMNFGTRRALKRVVAADISALLAWAAAMQGDRVGGLIFNDTNEFDLRPHTGRKTLMAYLHRLAEMPVTEAAAAQPRMLDICRHLARVARPGSAVYIVSDWQGFDKECERALYSVSRHCDLIAIRVIDPLEIQKPAGDYVLTDGRQRSRLSISNRDSAEQLNTWQERTNQLKHSLLHLQAPLIDVQTHEDPLDCLRQGMGFSADLSGVTV
ncbi:Protein of unknown function DUF58 [Thalassolituus maritimus]|uniref:DUF58 domain-containing protein n=1 Tax=Thalassolituus maritimus TaxID=484498 RepID=A0A1N7JAL6_9GAMM|nr:DUF58 domain-containing protein [Thalassolituus maritimus]SIS46412.1 Protein of unknown function DUF58 [Thalassolituus maritimus]